MSDVRVDEIALAAEASAVAAEFPHEAPGESTNAVQPEAPAGHDPEAVLQGYKVIATALVDRGASFAPAWTFAAEKKTNLAEALAQAAVLWWPSIPIPPKYLALLVVAHAVDEIIEANRDPVSGKLKPLRHAAKSDKQSAAPAQN